MHWLTVQKWDWAIRVKSDLLVHPAQGFQQSVVQLIPPSGQAYLLHDVQILEDASCHLATGNWPGAQELGVWRLIARRAYKSLRCMDNGLAG